MPALVWAFVRTVASASARAAVVLLVLGLALGSSGCGWVFAEDGTSASLGTHADGALRVPVMLPMGGDGYTVPSHWRPRNSNFGTEELVGLLVRSARAVDEQLPGGVVASGDLSRRGGGASIEHKSHRSGRDADIFYYAVDEGGRPVAPGDAMLRFNADGRAVRWSPARGEKPPNRSVPHYHFDTKRNWALVRALIVDPGTEVQWIFIQHNLAALLFREAVASGDDPSVLARAAYVLREPSDAEPHDDHMHVRVYCDTRDRAYGCVDKGLVEEGLEVPVAAVRSRSAAARRHRLEPVARDDRRATGALFRRPAHHLSRIARSAPGSRARWAGSARAS